MTATNSERLLFLSLKPRFAEAIVSGEKTIELRRRPPQIDTPTEALIYASSPTKELIGACWVDDVVGHGAVDTMEDFRAGRRRHPARLPAVLRRVQNGARSPPVPAEATSRSRRAPRDAPNAGWLPTTTELPIRRARIRHSGGQRSPSTSLNCDVQTLAPWGHDEQRLSRTSATVAVMDDRWFGRIRCWTSGRRGPPPSVGPRSLERSPASRRGKRLDPSPGCHSGLVLVRPRSSHGGPTATPIR